MSGVGVEVCIDGGGWAVGCPAADCASRFWPRFLLRSFLILPIRRVKSVNVGGFALWPCVSGSGWGFSGLGLVRRRR